MSLAGRRIHIAGSASSNVAPAVLGRTHELIRSVVRKALGEGAALAVQVGKEPSDETGTLAIVWDWIVLEELDLWMHRTKVSTQADGEPLIVVGTSEKAAAEIPDARRELWDRLTASGAVDLLRIPPGWRSAATIRELLAQEGNVLLIIGGGAGVEHLHDVYRRRRRPIVPLDSPLGASRGDGLLRGEGLARQARSDPSSFFRLESPGQETTRLARLSTTDTAISAEELATRVVGLIRDLAKPRAFFVRLLNKGHADFERVERFFRSAVEPVVAEFGLVRHKVSSDVASTPFLNLEIFEELYYSDVAVVDLTGLRANCFLELGFALRGPGTVIITAREDTPLPFDVSAIPCHFWKEGARARNEQDRLRDFWRTHGPRFPLVRSLKP